MTVRRLKTYTGQTGYVYQYYFVGKRPAVRQGTEAAATEYVFDVSSDRESYFAVSIFVQDDAVEAWAAAHGRKLAEPEQYAVGKMALFRSFDEVTDLFGSGRRIWVTPDGIESLAEALNLE